MLRDLGKLIVAKGFKKLPKVQKIAQSGHTDCITSTLVTLVTLSLPFDVLLFDHIKYLIWSSFYQSVRQDFCGHVIFG